MGDWLVLIFQFAKFPKNSFLVSVAICPQLTMAITPQAPHAIVVPVKIHKI